MRFLWVPCEDPSQYKIGAFCSKLIVPLLVMIKIIRSIIINYYGLLLWSKIPCVLTLAYVIFTRWLRKVISKIMDILLLQAYDLLFWLIIMWCIILFVSQIKGLVLKIMRRSFEVLIFMIILSSLILLLTIFHVNWSCF